MKITYETLVKQWNDVFSEDQRLEVEISNLINKTQSATGIHVKQVIAEISTKFDDFSSRAAEYHSRSNKILKAAAALALDLQLGDVVGLAGDDSQLHWSVADMAMPLAGGGQGQGRFEVSPGIVLSGEVRGENEWLIRLMRAEKFGDGWIEDESDLYCLSGTPEQLREQLRYPKERINIARGNRNAAIDSDADDISPSLLAGMEAQVLDENLIGTRGNVIANATLAALARADSGSRVFKCGDVIQAKFPREILPRCVVFYSFVSLTKEIMYYDGSVHPVGLLGGYLRIHRVSSGELSQTHLVMRREVHGMSDDGGNEILLAVLLAQKENLRSRLL